MSDLGTKPTCRSGRCMSVIKGAAEVAFRAVRSAFDPSRKYRATCTLFHPVGIIAVPPGLTKEPKRVRYRLTATADLPRKRSKR